MKTKYFLFVILTSTFLVLNLFTACTKNSDKNLFIDFSVGSNLAFSEKWAVVNTAYAAFRNSYNDTAKIEAPGRLGDTYRVLGHHITKDGENWYQFEKGWLPATSVGIFDNKLQAQFVAKKFDS